MRIVSSQQNKPARRKKASEERIGDLAVLPVFYKLLGKRVVLAGGSDAAAWKAHLLAAAGAFIDLYAEKIDPAFSTLLKEDQYHWHRRPWSTDIFRNAQIAVADIESIGEAKAFYCSAKAAGVPVNVIDKPEFCEFQFGSIVNRSPVVVSISTDGAAPILGQAIRRKIETLLPNSLQKWAELARGIRSSVNAKLNPGLERRSFWESFVDRAFSGEKASNSQNEMLAQINRIGNDVNRSKGRVTLVGAGPGDAELLTLKAVRALQSADVILFDDLVSTDVLELARREAKRMLVGKRGGKKSCKHDDINDTMVKLAKAGKNVVRLKGGDPMIFGRGGEELAKLNKENIQVSVIPGITSAAAMAASLGVSLTHRDHAQSVRFVTGHSRKGKLPTNVDWNAIADPSSTTVFYMGGRTATEIQSRLLGNGLDGHTAVVVASSVSRHNESRWVGTLKQLHKGIQEIGYDDPVLIGVGSAFNAANSEVVLTQESFG